MVQFIYGLSRPSRKRRGKTHDTINVKSDDEVRYWAQCLEVDDRTLTGAVKAVGPEIEKVREHLARANELDGDRSASDFTVSRILPPLA